MFRTARKYLFLLLAVLAVVYFFYKFRNAITLQGFHWSLVGHSLRQARLSLLVLSVAAIYACFAIRSLRWMRFSRALGHARFSSVYGATLMGFSCTFLLGRAGEPIRPVLIGRKDSLSIPGMFGVYVLERIFDAAATAVLAGLALLLFRGGGLNTHADSLLKYARSAGVLLLAGLLILIGFLVYFRFHGAHWLAKKLENPKWRSGWREKIAVLLEGFADGLQGIRSWEDLAVLVAYSAVHWFLVICVYFWVAHAFDGPLEVVTFAGAMLTLTFTLVGSAVQLPGVGGGAQLATFLVLTLIFGIAKEAAATVAVVLWLVSFSTCCFVGLPLLFREGWSMGELRQMARAEEQAGEAVLLEEAERGGRIEEPRA